LFCSSCVGDDDVITCVSGCAQLKYSLLGFFKNNQCIPLSSFSMCFLIGNVVMSSLLSALLMATSAVACSLILVAQVITFTSNVFISLLQPNQSAFGTFPGRNGQIAFYSERDGNQEIYVMNAADGSNQTRLTNNDADDFDSTWSPDGTKIAFGSSRDGNGNIYIMNAADGSNQTRLTNSTAWDSLPKWSPDGTKIAFYSERDGNGNIYIMNAADGSNQTRLTNSTADDLPPSWSPDGTKIAFGSSRDGNWEIYIMNAADGSGQTRLTNNAADDSEPDWSPA
jgi:Tol biopolymer transport system component